MESYYKNKEDQLRVNFENINIELSGLPAVFKLENKEYARGHIMLLNTGIDNVVLVYNVDNHKHYHVLKSNIFYINYEFLIKNKGLIIIALSDIKPKRNRAWGELEITNFRNLMANRTFIFFNKDIKGDCHIGWGKLNNNMLSLDDLLIEKILLD